MTPADRERFEQEAIHALINVLFALKQPRLPPATLVRLPWWRRLWRRS